MLFNLQVKNAIRPLNFLDCLIACCQWQRMRQKQVLKILYSPIIALELLIIVISSDLLTSFWVLLETSSCISSLTILNRISQITVEEVIVINSPQ